MNTSPSFNSKSTSTPAEQPLSQETVRGLQELGEVFRQIHHRLISEGYTIRDGKIFKPEADEIKDGSTQ